MKLKNATEKTRNAAINKNDIRRDISYANKDVS